MDGNRFSKHLKRFLASNISPGALIYLEEHEAHHLAKVLRLREGSKIILIDGLGNEYLGKIVEIKRTQVKVLVKEFLRREPLPQVEIIFFLPLLKKENTSFLIEKAVELGISKVILITTERTIIRPGEDLRSKLERRALQALKQCHRLWALKIEGPLNLTSINIQADFKIFAYEKETKQNLYELFKSFSGKRVAIISGPEGGFSEREAKFLLQKGFKPVSLGPYIMRAETAAFYLMSIAHYTCQLGLRL